MEREDIQLQVKEVSKGGYEGSIKIKSLGISVEELKKVIHDIHPQKLPCSQMRLLCSGKFLKEGTLESNGIKANSKIMILKGANKSETEEVQTAEKKFKEKERIKKAIDEVASRSDGGDYDYEQYHFVLEDQNGNKVQLPTHERKELIAGMTYQQKARKLVKSKKYAEAIDLLREADLCFGKVSQDILFSVDNFALLQLEMVWCMFQIKDPALLSEAKQRLDITDQIFQKIHGKNLERLKLLKGGFCPEQILYVRLHLLQMVAAYHSGDYPTAKRLCWKVDFEIQQLNVTDEQIQQLVQMGFSKYEARIALRACQKSVDQALNFILAKREKNQSKKREEQRRKMMRRKQIAFGKTKNGCLINMELFEKLLKSHDRSEEIVAEALKQSNNKEETAVQFLTQNYLLKELDRIVEQNIWNRIEPPTHLVQSLIQMGFDQTLATFALKKSNNVLDTATEMLLSGSINPQLLPPSLPQNSPTIPPPTAPQPPKGTQNDQTNNEIKNQEQNPAESTSAQNKMLQDSHPSTDQSKVIWQWRDSTSWVPYADKTSEELEFEFSQSPKNPSFQLVIGSSSYRIDFGKMTQTNSQTGFARKIRRVKTHDKSEDEDDPMEETADDVIGESIADTFEDEDAVYDIQMEEEICIFKDYKGFLENK